ncbi:hypothetical protein CRT60_00495 [Azospirillum palustre]|uniref:Core-binding (CB) domain-containing protein n=1 Tax=Azospirillum palustre TaxID=2044885 RepID=A0A2B8BKY2_9PROT|nr:hypothetical protein [Azospirillum palustre]PGH59446.1 hypothetical protein CRT60_00495 [Azospirillum palustre]
MGADLFSKRFAPTSVTARIPPAPTNLPPKPPGRRVRLPEAGAVDLGIERQRRGVRLHRGVGADGQAFLEVVFPTPGQRNPEQVLELGFLLDLPNLATPFSEAFLELVKTKGAPSRCRCRNWLHSGLVTYLRSHEPIHLGLDDIDTSLVNRYAAWLGRTVNGKAALSASLRSGYYRMFLSLIRILRESERWKASLRNDLRPPKQPWLSTSRRAKPTEILTDDRVQELYNACVSEVSATMEYVHSNRSALALTGPLPPDRVYARAKFAKDFALCLRALGQYYPHVVPLCAAIRKEHTSLGNALNTVHDHAKAMAVFQPSLRLLVPFVLLLGFHTAFNPTVLLKLKRSEQRRERLLGKERLRLTAFKGRSGRHQVRSFPVSEDADNPATILAFLDEWTARIRPLASPHDQDSFFLYVKGGRAGSPEKRYAEAIGSMAGLVSESTGTINASWNKALLEFCTDHGLDSFSLKQVRHTVLDIAHTIREGDLRAVQAIGQHRRPETILSHYTSDAARRRNDERLAQVMETRTRWCNTGGLIDARRSAVDGGDIGSATPGWLCLDPYSSPVAGQEKGRLCTAYGRCPSCPLASVDLASATACVRVRQLLHRVDEARSDLSAEGWLHAWKDIALALRETWLPAFSSEARNAAVDLPLNPIPPVV